MVVSRQIIAQFVKTLQEEGPQAIADPEDRKAVIQTSLNALQPHVVTFEEQVSKTQAKKPRSKH